MFLYCWSFLAKRQQSPCIVLVKAFHMIKRTVLLLAIVSSLAACGSSKKAVDDTDNATDNGAWQQQQVTADGNSKEWDKNNMAFDKDSKIAYKITNDNANLYVLITTTDHTSQTKILHAGMSLFIDPAAKKNETVAVNFPLGSGDAQGMGGGPRIAPDQQEQPGEKPDLQQMRAKALINANQYTLSGFSKGSGGYGITEENAAGISVKIDLNASGEMVYEAVIPWQSLPQRDFTARAGTPVSVGFKINALPKPAVGSGGGGGYSGGGGMRGGGIGGRGGRGGGGRASGSGNYTAGQQLFKEVKVWKHIVIAQKA
jgi:hypothetical protein